MSDDPINNDVDRAKQELKKRYKPEDYEALIEFAAKYFISDSRRRIEMDNFHQAMLNMEFAKAGRDEELRKSVEEAFQQNTLFKDVVRLNSLTGTFKAWMMNRKLHENDKKAKELVRSWWSEDKKNGSSKADVAAGYLLKLEEAGICPRKKKKKYEYEVIYDWLANL